MATNTFEYKVVRPRFLGPKTRRAINKLVATSAEIDYATPGVAADVPSHTPEQIDYFVDSARAMRPNLNRAVGKQLRSGQRFTRQRSILAFADGELVAHMPVADNASSAKHGILGIIERQGKLHLPEVKRGEKVAIESRFRWLGNVAMSGEFRETVSANTRDGVVTPLHEMTLRALEGADERQPVSTYPYAQEDTWMQHLVDSGLRPLPDEVSDGPLQEIVPNAFGPDSPALQETWRGNVGQVRRVIEQIPKP